MDIFDRRAEVSRAAFEAAQYFDYARASDWYPGYFAARVPLPQMERPSSAALWGVGEEDLRKPKGELITRSSTTYVQLILQERSKTEFAAVYCWLLVPTEEHGPGKKQDHSSAATRPVVLTGTMTFRLKEGASAGRVGARDSGQRVAGGGRRPTWDVFTGWNIVNVSSTVIDNMTDEEYRGCQQWNLAERARLNIRDKNTIPMTTRPYAKQYPRWISPGV